MCADEFKSTGGCDIHIRNVSVNFGSTVSEMLTITKMHKAEQRLVCVGCAAIFTRAGALMGHMERGECRNIKFQDFAEQRVKKDIMKAAMLSELEDEESLHVQSEPDNEDGGISISAYTRGVPEDAIKPSPADRGYQAAMAAQREREHVVASAYNK